MERLQTGQDRSSTSKVIRLNTVPAGQRYAMVMPSYFSRLSMLNAKKPSPHHHDMQGKTILAFRRIVLYFAQNLPPVIRQEPSSAPCLQSTLATPSGVYVPVHVMPSAVVPRKVLVRENTASNSLCVSGERPRSRSDFSVGAQPESTMQMAANTAPEKRPCIIFPLPSPSKNFLDVVLGVFATPTAWPAAAPWLPWPHNRAGHSPQGN